MKVLEGKSSGFDIQKLVKNYTQDLTINLAFGSDINVLEDPENTLHNHLSNIFPMLMSRMLSPIRYWRLIRLKRDKQYDESLAYVKVQLVELINAARKKFKVKSQKMPKKF